MKILVLVRMNSYFFNNDYEYSYDEDLLATG